MQKVQPPPAARKAGRAKDRDRDVEGKLAKSVGSPGSTLYSGLCAVCGSLIGWRHFRGSSDGTENSCRIGSFTGNQGFEDI